MSGASYNRTLGRLRLALTWAGVGLLIWWAAPRPSAMMPGTLLVAVGESIRVWAAGHLTKTRELVTSGPYRHTRNPLYLGRLLIFSGLCVMARLPHGIHWWVLAAGWLIFFGYYLPRKERVEPARLREFHGHAYSDYFRSVPALFPTGSTYANGSERRWSRHRFIGNREHWMVIGLTLVLVMFCWRAYSGGAG